MPAGKVTSASWQGGLVSWGNELALPADEVRFAIWIDSWHNEIFDSWHSGFVLMCFVFFFAMMLLESQ